LGFLSSLADTGTRIGSPAFFQEQKRVAMTDTSTPRPDENGVDDETGAGVRRPDQGGADQPGQTPERPASGGEGAAGAGGPDGFGTGT
jgi:hypothetical protein